MIRVYFEMLLSEAEATQALPKAARMGETAGKMKQFATWFTHGVPGGAKLRASIYQAKTGVEVLAQVEEFFSARPESNGAIETGAATSPDAIDLDFPEASLVCD
jgi:tRNA-dihydrouridine synthase